MESETAAGRGHMVWPESPPCGSCECGLSVRERREKPELLLPAACLSSLISQHGASRLWIISLINPHQHEHFTLWILAIPRLGKHSFQQHPSLPHLKMQIVPGQPSGFRKTKSQYLPFFFFLVRRYILPLLFLSVTCCTGTIMDQRTWT